MCSKQDYEAIAASLKKARKGLNEFRWSSEPSEFLDGIASELAEHFSSKNPLFDADRFLLAATVV